MKNKKAIIVLIVGLIMGYLVASGFLNDQDVANSENENTADEVNEKTNEDTLSEKEKMIDEYQKEKEEKIKKLTKKNLLDEIVGADEYGIVDDAPTVNVKQLLPTDTWQEFLFNEVSLVFKYPSDEPKEWWVQETESSNNFTMTTSESDEPSDESDWAKITVGLYERTPDQSLFDWMEAPLEKEGENVPPSDRTIQYVMIGESKFLGSVFFEGHTWAGQKNVYAEVSPTLVFAASLEVQNSVPDSDFTGKFDQIFYTMLESLEVK